MGSRLFGSRTRLIIMTLGAGFAILIIRLFYLQVVQADMWKEKASSQQMYSTSISANRGNIYDRNMKTLAKSVTVWTVFISPAEMEEDQRELVASGLSEILDVDYDMVYEKSLKTWRYNETIKKKVDNDTADEVTAFIKENDIKGIYLSEDTMRYYPYGNLASTVLGFTGNDGTGAYGLEAYYNKTLSGTNGVIASVRNAKGTAMPFSEQQIYDAEDGQSLVLTIDETVQHYLEKHLENAVQEHEVQNRAVGIVMNVKTGEILGMSTKPDFDPNNPSEIYDTNTKAELDEMKEEAGDDEEKLDEYYTALGEAQMAQWRNKAISDPYEPGSVFKLITASAALETGTVTGSTPFYCPGYIEVAGNRISCWKIGGHGAIDFVGAIKGSCNPAFIMTGQALGAELFMEYLDKFGLYDITGVDLPGEATSIMHSWETMMNENMASLSSASFGQTFKVTALQLMTAVNASVNGGYLMQPYIVSQVLDSDGNVVSNTEPVVVRQVISEETSALIASYAEQVVSGEGGSGARAAVPGYRIGGKTGTSQKLDQEGDDIILSFYGFAPADDPEIAVLVMLDEPQKNNQYGSVIAAPVVGNILADILPYLGFEPNYTEEQLSSADMATPYLINYGLQEAQTNLVQAGLQYRVVGNGTTVVDQTPGAAMPIPGGGTVVLYTEETERQTAAVPYVIGKSGNEANRMILNAGFNIKIEGESIEHEGCVAVSQSIEAGENAEIGTVITVTFEVQGNALPD